MARYKLLVSEELEPTGEVESIDTKKMVDLAAQRMVKMLLDNKTAVKGTIKVKKFVQKFQVTWQNAKTQLYQQRSYVAFISKKGAILMKGSGSLRAQVEPFAEA